MNRMAGWTALFCFAEVLTMFGVFAFPALLPTFVAAWELSNLDAGWIAGIYFAGYTLAVPVLVSLTDRVDSRLIYLGGAGLTAVAAAAFAALAEGFWTALVLRAVAGVGLAGTYMPGLRALVDRCPGPGQSRAVAFYTASFSLGTALSFLMAGEVEQMFGWRAAFAAAAATAAVAVAVVALAVRPQPPQPAAGHTALLDFRPVLANRPAMGYVLAYGAHAWELFGMRSWLVAFLAFSLALEGGGGLAPTTVAALGGLVAMAASIGGQEVAARFGRRRVISLFMLGSAAMALVIGFTAPLPYAAVTVLALLYGAVVQLDSAALTAGAVEAAAAGRRGATLAVHSVVGFTGAFLGPLAVGLVLDLAGGSRSVLSWGLAFASLGAVVALGPLALGLSRRQDRRR